MLRRRARRLRRRFGYRWQRRRFLLWAHTREVKRLDRERMYVWVHASLVFVGLGIALKPVPVGVLASLSRDADRGLATMILSGSTICLIGACMGSRCLVRRATVDVRIPYAAAAFGQLSVVASLFAYSRIILEYSDLWGTLAGALSIGITLACAHIATVAIKETWRFTHHVTHPDCPWHAIAGERRYA